MWLSASRLVLSRALSGQRWLEKPDETVHLPSAKIQRNMKTKILNRPPTQMITGVLPLRAAQPWRQWTSNTQHLGTKFRFFLFAARICIVHAQIPQAGIQTQDLVAAKGQQMWRSAWSDSLAIASCFSNKAWSLEIVWVYGNGPIITRCKGKTPSFMCAFVCELCQTR